MGLVWHEYWDLQPYNSFGLAGRARWFAQLRDERELAEVQSFMQETRLPVHVLGGGSNVLLRGDIDALVLHVATRGLRLVSEEADGSVVLEAEAGELWHDMVVQSLQLGLAGLENLSLIPGTVGAAPVQNIGAYGVELGDLCAGVTVWDWQTAQKRDFSLEECAFAYRDSRFKHEAGRWLVLRVRFRLSRTASVHLEYGPIRQQLAQLGIQHPTPTDVSQVVCAIRREKLPDPSVLGNAGSFFKNPVVSAEQAVALRQRFPELVLYPQADGRVKLAAAWLIDQAGWKGFRIGDAGVHQHQALVLVNYGHATGAQILELAQRIQHDIAERFGVCLEMEPVLL